LAAGVFPALRVAQIVASRDPQDAFIACFGGAPTVAMPGVCKAAQAWQHGLNAHLLPVLASALLKVNRSVPLGLKAKW